MHVVRFSVCFQRISDEVSIATGGGSFVQDVVTLQLGNRLHGLWEKQHVVHLYTFSVFIPILALSSEARDAQKSWDFRATPPLRAITAACSYHDALIHLRQ